MRRKGIKTALFIGSILLLMPYSWVFASQKTISIALNYPETGPYSKQGKDQWKASSLAQSEINAAGGILGNKVLIRWYNTESKPAIAQKNARRAIDIDGVKMIFGGSSSAVAIAVSKIAQEKKVPFFGTLTYSNATTGKEGRRHTFRECYNAWMSAKAISKYLNKDFKGKKYFYITADYTWGWSTESSLRKFTNTEDKKMHPGILTPFPSKDFKTALKKAQEAHPDVLALVLFGDEMAKAVRTAAKMGMKNRMQIVVPNLTIGMAERGTPRDMEGVIGAVPWTWKVPYEYNYDRGKQFVEKFAKRYNRYPSSSAASAYTIMYQYKEAVERAKSFEASAVIKALEGHKYKLLKDTQEWRDFDHQSIQTVYTVRCNPRSIVMKDKYHLDYFDILDSISGPDAVRTREQWNAVRKAANKLTRLEAL
jgi:ABC-type branched-subunit amino acid transport system substrate-binding protein